MRTGFDTTLLKVDELADYWKISKPTVYRLVEKRSIPFHKIGGSLRFSKADIDSYMQQNRIEPIQ